MTGAPQIVLPDAVALDGSEYVTIDQKGALRRVQLSMLVNLTPTALILPAVDPHVVGALWNNAGTITVSAG